MASRRLRSAGQALSILLVLGLVAAAFVAVAQPRIVVGPPLPQVATMRFPEKPDPPKQAARSPLVKPGVVDLVQEPAPLTVADPNDPTVQALTPVLLSAITRSGDAGASAVHVLDDEGRIVFDVGGTSPLLPASTAKLVTAAAALTAFGPDHTFSTTLDAVGIVDAQGVLRGDLLLTGGGDPTLVSQGFIDEEVAPERPQTPIAALAEQVVAAGITRVEGAVIGDGGYLEGRPLARGWPPRYLEDLDARPISGLTVDAGLELYTTDAGTVRSRAAADPAAQAARALTDALVERGVEVTGVASSLTRPPPEPTSRLGSLASPPLQPLLVWMVQTSDNHLADTLFRAVGRRIEGTGTFADGLPQAEAVLAELQLDWSTTQIEDGSGLSRDSRIPPALLAALNYRMTNSSVGAVWQELMAVSGESGTLQRRLVDSIAERRLRGKTGSLADVRALTGAVVGPDGRPLYFSVVSNALEGPQLASARRLQDLVVLGLAAHLYGCSEIVPTEPPQPEPSGLPPLPAHTC